MTVPNLTEIHTDRSDNRLYIVWRNGRPYKCSWHQMSGQERNFQIEAEKHAYYVDLFNPCGIC